MAFLLRKLASKTTLNHTLTAKTNRRQLSTTVKGSFFNSPDFKRPRHAWNYGPSGVTESMNLYMKRGPVDTTESWKDSDKTVHMRFDVPGVCKEKLKLIAQGNKLYWEGQAVKHPLEETGRVFRSVVILDPYYYHCGDVKAELVDGVLYLRVPVRANPGFDFEGSS